jgi:hypothetical protein
VERVISEDAEMEDTGDDDGCALHITFFGRKSWKTPARMMATRFMSHSFVRARIRHDVQTTFLPIDSEFILKIKPSR